LSSRIDAVIFDNAGVLFSSMDGIGKKYTWQMPRSPDKLQAEFMGEEFTELIQGKITEKEFFKALKSARGWVGETCILKNLVREHLKPIPGTLDIVKQLHEKGMRLALLSGHAKEWVEYLQKEYQFHHYFDKILYSYMVGYGKENPEFFKDILQLLELPAENCLMVDDSAEYLDIAKSLGMQTLLFTDAEDLAQKLSLAVSL